MLCTNFIRDNNVSHIYIILSVYTGIFENKYAK